MEFGPVEFCELALLMLEFLSTSAAVWCFNFVVVSSDLIRAGQATRICLEVLVERRKITTLRIAERRC